MQYEPEGSLVYKQIADEYASRLSNRDIAHPRIFLIFSAVPGSGKTTLALRLARDLQAQYVNHDEIRKIVRERGIDLDKLFIPFASKALIDDIMQKDQNRFVVLDASIDRSWPMFFEHANRLGGKAGHCAHGCAARHDQASA